MDNPKPLVVRHDAATREVEFNERFLTFAAHWKFRPRLATADGALGFWKALREVYPGTREQTCWFHKAGQRSLDKMPKVGAEQRQGDGSHEMWQAPSLEEAKEAYDQFCEAWADKYPKAVALPAQG